MNIFSRMSVVALVKQWQQANVWSNLRFEVFFFVCLLYAFGLYANEIYTAKYFFLMFWIKESVIGVIGFDEALTLKFHAQNNDHRNHIACIEFIKWTAMYVFLVVLNHISPMSI